ncbi:MAG: DUF3108 domain-containing protein [Bryobacteraceae bacterium]
MKRPSVLLILLLTAPLTATDPTGFPFQDESLRYSVNWPGGVSLGEGQMRAKRIAVGWQFELLLDAAIPGFAISDSYRSLASNDLCSSEFEKKSAHGERKASEKVEFRQDKQTAKRTTASGGSSDIGLSACAKDALAFLYYTRREMGQGRVPRPETVLGGAPYQMRLEYMGEQSVASGKQQVVADRVVASLRGPASTQTFELFFARDAARTPLAIRVPFALGTFSLDLVR